MQPPNTQLTKADRLEAAIDKRTTSELQINRHGQVSFVNANEIMEFAKVMALAKQAIPPHLRENPGACMAVCIQASSWTMSPFAVANKSYVVNDRMAYEAQIIAAVILMRAPIIGRLKYSYKGEGPARQCTCTAKLDDGDTVDYTTPMIKDIKVKNSPLWIGDPDQQLGYSAARALARRHFPDVILGVYTPDEMAEETMRDVGPPSFTQEPAPPVAKLPAPEAPLVEQGAATDAPEPSNGPSFTSEEAQPPDDADRQTMLTDLQKRQDKAGIADKAVKAWAHKEGLIPTATTMKKDFSIETLQALDERWSEIAEAQ